MKNFFDIFSVFSFNLPKMLTILVNLKAARHKILIFYYTEYDALRLKIRIFSQITNNVFHLLTEMKEISGSPFGTGSRLL